MLLVFSTLRSFQKDMLPHPSILPSHIVEHLPGIWLIEKTLFKATCILFSNKFIHLFRVPVAASPPSSPHGPFPQTPLCRASPTPTHSPSTSVQERAGLPMSINKTYLWFELPNMAAMSENTTGVSAGHVLRSIRDEKVWVGGQHLGIIHYDFSLRYNFYREYI